jgi:transcription elongation factor B subunit 1
MKERCASLALVYSWSFLRRPNDPRGIITEKLVEYMCFKTHYESATSKEDIPANEFMERVPPEIVLELFVFSLPPRWAD